MGAQRPVGSSSSGVHGPAAAITAPAATDSTVHAHANHGNRRLISSVAARPTRTTTPRVSASVAKAYVPEPGATG